MYQKYTSYNMSEQITHEVLFNRISQQVKNNVSQDFIASMKTHKGNTQQREREVIERVESILNSMELTFKKASSQEPEDFQNIGGIGLNIEIKKTDSGNVIFNDTCPTKDIWYIIFFTGSSYKRKKNIPPTVICLNGIEFINGAEWLHEYNKEMKQLKDKYGRGPQKKQLGGIMEVYPRPNYKANIIEFIRKEHSIHEDR
jgi:frataxin-like iron-binding protein CyaY